MTDLYADCKKIFKKQEYDFRLCKKILEVITAARQGGELICLSKLAEEVGVSNSVLHRLAEEYPQMEYVFSHNTAYMDLRTLLMRCKEAIEVLRGESKRVTVRSIAHYVYEGHRSSFLFFNAKLVEYPWLGRFVTEASTKKAPR